MANTSVIVIPEGKICDYVDGKFRNDTPEEYVRQTIEKRLVGLPLMRGITLAVRLQEKTTKNRVHCKSTKQI